jgi:DNA invertase Pin-like site-specific DNA recombinase
VTRPLLTALLVTALVGAASAAPAGAQEDGSGSQGGGGPPTELWDEFPLKQPAPGSAERDGRSAAPAPGSTRSDEPDDGSSGTLPLLLAGVAALAALALAAGAAIRIRRRRSRPAETGPPVPTPQTRSVEPAVPEEVATDGSPPSLLAAPQAAGPEAEPAPAPELVPEPGAPDRPRPDAAPTVVPMPAAGKPRDGAAAADASGPPSRPGGATPRAVGYASVSAADDFNSAELKVQVRLIQEACQRRGLALVKIVRDVESHASSDLRRPGLTYALDRLAARDASCLVVTSLERLTRTAANLGALLGWLTECDARLVVIDLDLDTGTEEGQLGARALATVGGLERRKLEERTRKGLEAARNTRRSGRPAVSDRPSLKQRIADMRAQGMTLQAIADTLNSEGVPTLRGGAEWRPSSVQAAAGYKRPRRKSVLQSPAQRRDKRA